MPEADSVLEAAKKLAAIVNLPWSDVQPVYRALQEEDGKGTSWLPKSRGRTIWTAHPNYLSRLLIALGFGGGPSNAHAQVGVAQDLTPNGRQKHITERPYAGNVSPVESKLFGILTNPNVADAVEKIEFDARMQEIGFVMTDHRHSVLFQSPTGTRVEPSGISFRGVIHGDVLQRLAREINWRTHASPVDHRDANDGDDE